MVFLMELEGDGVSQLGNNSAGVECEKTRAADNDTVIATSGGSGGGRRIYDDRSGGGSRWRRGR